jgi:hypothetical protein
VIFVSSKNQRLKTAHVLQRFFRLFHLNRSAVIGSTFVARRAGLRRASGATDVSSNTIKVKVSGSVALTPDGFSQIDPIPFDPGFFFASFPLDYLPKDKVWRKARVFDAPAKLRWRN